MNADNPNRHPAFAPLAREDTAPVFDQPWQAQVLALAAGLAEAGLFTPTEWSEAFGARLKAAEQAGAADDMATYYQAAIDTVEALVAERGNTSAAEQAARREQWRQAYLNTPHGQPVLLSAAGPADG